MDFISVVGILVGVLAIIVGQLLEGGHVSSLVQPTAFLIVIGGTLGAVMLQSPWRTFARGMGMIAWVFRPPVIKLQNTIAEIVVWAGIARKEGLLALESRLDVQFDPYIHKGLQMLVDGIEPENIRGVLEVEINVWENQLKQAARVWESAAGYAPTIGILGAVLGLIHVMENLTDPAKLGAGIAVAFVATIYGVGSANLLFFPIAKKLQGIIGQLISEREMVLDGLICIAHGDNPRLIESRLESYMQK
jgi:chemotaxis protein MotA